MARERWFYAQGNQRRGPVPFNQLVESVLGQPEPRTVLVWRKGFADWTRAEDVPEVERRLAPFLAKKAAEEAAKRGPAPAPVEAQPAAARPRRGGQARQPRCSCTAASPPASRVLGPPGVAVLAARRAPGPRADGAAARRHDHRQLAGGRDPGAAARDARRGARRRRRRPSRVPLPTPTPGRRRPRRCRTARRDLPAADLKRLRGVATWAGDTLKLTVYNGTTWRVTELYVKISRFKDDDFVEDPRAVVLVPPGRVGGRRRRGPAEPRGPRSQEAGPQPRRHGPLRGQGRPAARELPLGDRSRPRLRATLVLVTLASRALVSVIERNDAPAPLASPWRSSARPKRTQDRPRSGVPPAPTRTCAERRYWRRRRSGRRRRGRPRGRARRAPRRASGKHLPRAPRSSRGEAVTSRCSSTTSEPTGRSSSW